MTQKDQIDAFSNDIDALINRYASEFDLSYGEVIGVLFIKSHELSAEVLEQD
jgi:hypothetical protein